MIDAGAVECAAEPGQVALVEPGSCFGASAILGANGHQPRVTAVMPVIAWTITRADFIRCLGGPAPRSAIKRRSEAAD